MTVTPRSPAPGDGRLLEAHDVAAEFLKDQLSGGLGDGPRAYLHARGFSSVIDSPRWTIGYAPPSWTALTDHLRFNGFDTSEIQASGLGLRTRRHTVVDRFRDRITFGIRDECADLVAFIGRAAPKDRTGPRYLNSPQSAIYDKSAVLFGLGEQRVLLASGGTPVLVEGPLDAIAVSLTDARLPFVGLASCGTALTAAHVSAVTRATARPVLVAFDGDHAGRAAAAAAHGLLAHRTSTRAVRLAPTADPASIFAGHGPTGLGATLADTVPLADLVVDEVLDRYANRMTNAEARICALRELAPIVATFPIADIARQSARLGALLELDHETVTRELSEAASRASFRPQPALRRRRPQQRRSAGVPPAENAVLRQTHVTEGRKP